MTTTEGPAVPAGMVARECPYNHPIGSRCPNCADWPYAKGGASAYTPTAASPAPATPHDADCGLLYDDGPEVCTCGPAAPTAASPPSPVSAGEDVAIGEFIARWEDAADGVCMGCDDAQMLARELKRLRDVEQSRLTVATAIEEIERDQSITTETCTRIYAALKRAAPHRAQVAERDARIGEDVAGWVVGSADGKRWRHWFQGAPEWVDNPEEATRYARRCDAEAVHREDEDAWIVKPYAALLSDSRP